MTRFGTLVRRIDERGRGVDLPLMSVSQTLGVVRRSELTKDPPRAESLDEYKICRAGDIVFNKMSIRDGAMGVAREDGLVTYHYEVMRTQSGADPRYVVYLMKSEWFTAELIKRERGIGAGGTSGVRTTEVPFSVLRIIDAPISESTAQGAIADYLDEETARLDSLVERRTAQLEAFRERLDSEVERRVLGFLGASGRESQSSPFFQSRPIDWTETTLRHLSIEVQTGPFGSQLHAEEYVEGGTPIINPMHLVDGTIVPSNTMTVAEDKRRDLSRHSLNVGDIVVARRGELGRVAVVDEASAGYLCGTGCLRLRPVRSLLRSGYLSMLLSSAPLRAYFDTASVGSTMDNLSAERLLTAPVLVPPLSEQEDIELAVEAARRGAGVAIVLMARQIELLAERRQALITAVVTGQLAIPGVAA